MELEANLQAAAQQLTHETPKATINSDETERVTKQNEFQRFEEDQNKKRIAFEEMLERKKSTRDWIAVFVSIVAAVLAALAVLDAHDTTELDQRAFVFVQNAKWDAKNHSSDSLMPIRFTSIQSHLSLGVKGKTPALNVQIRTKCTVDPSHPVKTIPEDQSFRLAYPLASTEGVVWSGCSVTTEQTNSGYFGIAGEIKYEDFFHHLHHSSFCYDTVTILKDNEGGGEMHDCRDIPVRFD